VRATRSSIFLTNIVDSRFEVLVARLSSHQIEPYLSAYLMGGWRQDALTLDSVDVEDGRIRGLVRVSEFFTPGDGVFHLTVPSVFIWVAQLAIIYGCWEHKLARKPGEIYVREISLKCKRPVNTTADIEFVLTLLSRREVPEGTYYSGSISVDREAFVGDGRFVFPLPR
jgi:hypothetical protein